MEPTKRLFVGVRVPPLPRLRHFANKLSGLGSALRIVAPHNWHITLKFLGDTTAQQQDGLVTLLTQMAEMTEFGTVRVQGTGAFPDLHRPSVIWAGLQPPDDLAKLAAKLEADCEPLGFARDKYAWQAHLTLAYIKHRPPEELHTELQRAASTHFGDVALRELELIESTLTPDGPIYSTVADVPLQRV